MQILRTEHVFTLRVLSRDSIAVLANAAGGVGVWIKHVATATRPSESTDAQTLDGHHPDTTDNILAIVRILLVDTLTIVDTYLIVE